jgi:hypothetical protein
MTFITHGFRVSVASDVRDFRITFALYVKKIFIKEVVPNISRPKKSRHFLMYWMSVKLPDNFQMREHSWPCRFHIMRALASSLLETKILVSMSEEI